MKDTEDRHTSKCIECGKEFTGRPDKKFCCRDCKNKYNNRKNRMVIRSRKETIGALDHNYEILSYMFALGIRSAKLDELCALGFSPETVCSHRKSAGGHNEYSCYDLVYDQTDVKIFNLRKKDIIREISPSVPRDKR